MSRQVYRVADSASRDLASIWWTIAKDSPDDADRFLDQLADKFSTIGYTPGIGVRRSILPAGWRVFPFRSYLICYRPLDTGEVEIARVIHAARDLQRVLAGE